jgi:hypothetical protein
MLVFFSSLCVLRSTIAHFLSDDPDGVNFFFDEFSPVEATTGWELGFEESSLESISLLENPKPVSLDWIDWTEPVQSVTSDALCAAFEEYQYGGWMRRRQDGNMCSSSDPTNNVLQPLQLQMPDLSEIGETDSETGKVLPIDGEGGNICVAPFIHHLCCEGPEWIEPVRATVGVVYPSMVGCEIGT